MEKRPAQELFNLAQLFAGLLLWLRIGLGCLRRLFGSCFEDLRRSIPAANFCYSDPDRIANFGANYKYHETLDSRNAAVAALTQ